MEPEFMSASGMHLCLKLVLGLEYRLPGLEEHLEPQSGLLLHRHTVREDISILDQWGLSIRAH